MISILTALMLSAAPATTASVEPAVGQPAPDFTLPDNDGKPWTLSEHRGHSVVIVFYPRAFTGG